MSDRLTLVVFKDHLSSRTLTVRLAWLRAFGLALLSVIALAVIAGSLFLNAYRKTLSSGSLGDSRRAAEMEKELADMKASYESLKEQALNRAAGGNAPAAAGSNAFTSLPPDTFTDALPAKETLPFRLESIKASWKGSTLQIRSAIEYAKEDGGNQQGHFILVARGPQSIHSYPENTFAAAGSPALMKPDSGEFFSVSRYREVKADFGPFPRHDSVQTIEIYVFDTRKRLIYFDRVGLEQSGKSARTETITPTESEKEPAAPAAPKAAAPVKTAKPVAPAPAVEVPAAASPETPSATSGEKSE